MGLSLKPSYQIQNFFIDPQYHLTRHITLLILFAIMAINNGLSILTYESENIEIYHIILYITLLLAKYIFTLYVAFYYLAPRFLLQKKYGTFFFLSVLWVFLMVIIETGLDYMVTSFFNIPLVSTVFIDKKIAIILNTLTEFFLQIIIYIGVFITIFLKYWTKDKQRMIQLENQQIRRKLEQLKEQLNPGFLFKTLQRIAHLEKKDPDKASEMMLKFSNLLRYQLYECKREEVFLSSEIQFITHYLNLEKLYNYNFNYQLILPALPPPVLVPPLLFISLIEEITDQNNQRQIVEELKINFLWNDEHLIFTVSSYKTPIQKSKKYLSTKQRLELLYKKGYNLQERQSIENEEYNIYLKIAI